MHLGPTDPDIDQQTQIKQEFQFKLEFQLQVGSGWVCQMKLKLSQLPTEVEFEVEAELGKKKREVILQENNLNMQYKLFNGEDDMQELLNFLQEKVIFETNYTKKGSVSDFVGRIPLPLLESRISRNH